MNHLTENRYGVINIREQGRLHDCFSVVSALLDSGEITQLSRGGFVSSSYFSKLNAWEQYRARIACQSADFSSGVIVGISAAIWHKLWIHDSGPVIVEVHRKPSLVRTTASTKIRVYHVLVEEEDIEFVDGIAVTSIARTILDIYRIHGAGPAFLTTCSALHAGVVTIQEIRDAAARCPWIAQLHLLDRVLAEATAKHSSPAPALFHAQAVLYGGFNIEIEEHQANTVALFRVQDTQLDIVIDNIDCPLNELALSDARSAPTSTASPANTEQLLNATRSKDEPVDSTRELHSYTAMDVYWHRIYAETCDYLEIPAAESMSTQQEIFR